MNIEITKVQTKEEAKICNSFLTQLILDEKKYDKNINENFIVNYFYEDFYLNDNFCLLLAKQNDEYIGYIYGFIIDSDCYLEKVAKIDAMFIKEEYRNQKIGESLIKKFKIWAKSKNINVLELSVCDGNKQAINLYKKENFKNIKMIMQCNLD